jgi:hypothetical protein
MPASSEIVEVSTRVAHVALPLAVAWHVVLAAVAVVLARGFQPSQRLATALLAAPLASVSVLAFSNRNVVDGAVFAVAALASVVLGLRNEHKAVERCSSALAVWALLLLEFAWIYPHFLADHFVASYLYAAPLGLLPCPTLAAVIELSIFGSGFGARAWSTLMSALGIGYGSFGAMKLGVTIDVLLVIGGFILLGITWSGRRLRLPVTPPAQA